MVVMMIYIFGKRRVQFGRLVYGFLKRKSLIYPVNREVGIYEPE